MQNIPITDDQYKKLVNVAKAAGYEDIPAFIGALANEPITDPRGPLTEKELRESVAMIRRGEEELVAGKYRDMKEALLEIGRKRGYSIEG